MPSRQQVGSGLNLDLQFCEAVAATVFLTYASQFLFEDLVKTLKVRKQVCFKLQRGWAWRELRG